MQPEFLGGTDWLGFDGERQHSTGLERARRGGRRVFERAYASLRPGGRFAWNFFVFDPRIAAANDGEWLEQNGIRHRIDHAMHDNRVDVTLESGDAISLWWLNRSEWEGLIETAGFEVEALYGGFDRSPFDETANEFVWVVRKP